MKTAVPRLGRPQVHHLRDGAELTPARPHQVLIAAVGPADKRLQIGGGGIRQAQQWHRLKALLALAQGWILQMGTQEAEGHGVPEMVGQQRHDLQQGTGVGTAGRHGIGQLDVVELLVAPKTHQHPPRGRRGETGQQQQHLQRLGGVKAMGAAELFDALLGGRGQGPAGAGLQGHRRRRQGDGPLLVGGIAAIGTGQDQVFAGLGGDHELLAGGTADGAAVGLHRHGPQAAALENAPVGAVHGGIGAPQAGLIGMEGIGVLHDEFATAHQAETGPDLIAELGLDLIQADRQLPVGAQQVGRQLGDHLLMGGAEPQGAILAVDQVEHDPLPGGVAIPAATAAPEVGGLQLGQQGFKGVDGRHLLANDGGDLLEHPPQQGQVGEDSRRQPPHVARPEQQFVGGDLRFGRVVPKRHQHEAGDAHGESPDRRWTLSPQAR